MNILDFKRKALGHTFRSADGASAADRGYTPGSNDKFIWSTQGTGDNEQRVYTLNPNYVAPPDPEIARAKIAAALGVPVSSVVPQYGTMLGGRDDNTQVTDYDNVTGYAVKQSDSHGVVFDNAGKQIGVYNPSNKGGGGFLGELLAGLDDTLGLSKIVTGISGGLADLDSSLGLSKNAPAIVGLAASYFLPGIGQALGQSLVSSGVITGAAIPYATTIGTALAQTGVSVAQGKSLDQALGDAILSGGMSELTQAYGSGVKSAISQITDNPIAQKAIFKAGTDVVSAVAQGKTGDEVLQGIGRSVVSTVAGAAANEIVKNIPGIDNLPDAAKRVVTSGIATSIQGGDGTKSMLNTALREGTTYVLDTLTATPGASAANPMSQDPAQRAASTGVTANTVAGSAQTQPVTGGNVTETTLPSLGNTTNVTSITGGAADGSTGTNYVTPIRGGAADGSTGTNYVTSTQGGAADGSTGTNYVTPIIGGAADASTGTNYVTPITGGAADASTGTNYVTPIKGGAADASTGTESTSVANGLTKTGDADPWGDLEGAMLKAASGEPVKFTDAQLTDMVRKGLVFDGGDYSTKQDAANEARLKGFTQFWYDNSVYTMQPGGPTEKALFQAVIDMQPDRNAAFGKARDLLGANKEYPYQGKKYTTETKEESNARQYNSEAAIQARMDLIPAYGGSINTRTGTPAGVANTFIDQKTNQVVEDTRVWDAAGNVVSGSLSVSDQSKALQVAGSLVLDAGSQLIDAFTGVGKFLGAIDKNGEFAKSVNKLSSFNEAQKPPEVKAESAQFWENVKNADGVANAARVVLSSVVDQPLMTGFNIASEMIQTLGTLGAGAGVKYASALLKAAPTLAAKLGIGVDIVLNIGESAGATYNESYKKALASVGAQVKDGSMTAAQAEAYAEDAAGKTFLAAAGVTGAISLLPGGNALAKQVLGSGVENAAMKATFKEAIKSDAAKVGYDLALKTSIKEAGSEGAEAFAIEAANQKILSPDADYNWKDLVTTSMLETIYGGGHSAAIASADIAVSNFQDRLIASGVDKTEVDNLTQKVSDLVKSGGASPSAIADLTAEASNLLGSVGYRIDPALDLMSDQFLSGVVSQEVASEMSLAGMSPEQIAQNLTSAVTHVESGNRIDPTYVDPFLTDDAEARQIAQSLGYTNPSPEVLKSLTGPISNADAQAKLDEFLNGMTAFESGKPVTAAEAQEMMKDLGLTGMSDAEAVSLATQIVQSVPTDMLAPDPNIQLASDAGFPDVATYTQYGGDKAAYNAAQADAANLAIAQAAGFPDYASYSQFGGNLAAYDKTNNDAANIRKATESGFPDYATFLQYDGNIFEYATAKKADENKQVAIAAGFPDFSTYTQYGGDKASYDAAIIATANAELATNAGFPDFSTYTQYSGDVGAFNKASQNSATKLEIETAIADAVSKINLPAGITPADVTAAIKTYMTDNPGLSLADVAGKITESTKGLATDTSVQTAISTALKDVATTADVNSAIAGIKFPAGITVADVANQIKAELAANPGLTANDVAKSISTYMTANPGLSAADVKTAIDASTKNFATKTDIEAAISGIQFPAGLTTSDVSKAIDEYMKANPGLTLRQVADSIAAATSGLPTEAGVRTTVADALKGVATKSDVTDAIAGIKFPPGLSKDDVVSSITTYMAANPALTLAEVAGKITDATKGLVTSADMKLALEDALKGTATTADVKALETKLTGEIAAAIASGLTGNEAIQKGLETLSTKMGTNQAELLNKLGTTETAITERMTTGLGELTTKVEGINSSLTAAIAANQAAGLTRDEATQKAINDVAGQLGTTKADLLTQLGTTEAALTTKLNTGLEAVNTKIESINNSLTTAIADAKATGLTGDAALQAAINKVAADQKVDSAALLTSIGATEASLKTQFASEIAGVTKDIQTKYDALTQAQKDAVNAQVQQGKDLAKAITDATSGLQTQIDALSGTAKTQYDSLTQAQKDAVAAQVQQGKDLTKAITDSSSGLQTQITNLSGDLQTKYDALTQGQRDIVNAQTQQGVDLNTAINEVSKVITKDVEDVKKDVGTLRADTQTRFDTLDQGQKDLVISQVKLGVDVEKAIDDASKKTTQQITDVKTDLKKDIGDAQTQFNTRVDDLVNQGQTYQAATQTALNEIKATQAAEKVAAEAAAKAGRASTAQQGIARNLQQAAARVTPAPGVVDTSTPGFADIGLKTSGDAAKFEGPLEQYMKMLAGNSNAAKTQETQQPQQGAQVQDELSAQQQPGSDYFAYGQQTDIDLAQSPGTQMLYSKAGGLATPLFADGGTTRHGKYAGGGLNVVEHSGKHRIDFRTGNAVTGPGDGQSDDIPAMLADGEFVFPADVVAALGNGSTKAGSDKLYDMMHSIRAYHRSAKPRDLPPPAKKSPLDYLKKRKVRR